MRGDLAEPLLSARRRRQPRHRLGGDRAGRRPDPQPFVYRLVAVFAWTIAALNILGLREPVRSALDSFGVVIGGLRVTPLLVIKTTVLLLLTLWAGERGERLPRTARAQRRRSDAVDPGADQQADPAAADHLRHPDRAVDGRHRLLGARLLLRRGRRRARLRPAEDRLQPGERHHPARRQVDQAGRRDLGRRQFRLGRAPWARATLRW